MENGGRRGRRRSRGRREGYLFVPPAPASFFGNSLVFVGVVCLAFFMLQYNCKNCYAKQELMKITSSVEDIAKHLNTIQSNYKFMEEKLDLYTKEIPKLEEQLSSLEVLAQAIELNRFGWNPRVQAALPFVDVKLNQRQKIPNKNSTNSQKSVYRVVKNNGTQII